MDDNFIKQTQDVISNTTDKFKQQTEDLINAAKDMQHPEKLREIAEENLQKSTELYSNALEVTKDAREHYIKAMDVVRDGTQKLGEKALKNFNDNSEAAFEVMKEISTCKSVGEANQLIGEFLKKQMELAGNQTKDFVEVAKQVAEESGEAFQSANQKTTEKLQNLSKD